MLDNNFYFSALHGAFLNQNSYTSQKFEPCEINAMIYLILCFISVVNIRGSLLKCLYLSAKVSRAT